MLNISENHIGKDFRDRKFQSLELLEHKKANNLLYKASLIALAILILIGLLPWTQNINARGQVTALNPEERPQTIHSIIPGRIEN